MPQLSKNTKNRVPGFGGLLLRTLGSGGLHGFIVHVDGGIGWTPGRTKGRGVSGTVAGES